METDIARGQWVDPRAGQLLLSTYAQSWLAARADLKVRTRELYQWLLGKYVLPQLGHLPLDQLSPTSVRAWHASLLGAGAPTPPRQAYALLRAILNTTVADELLTRNPCLVRGAGVGHSAERSMATLTQVQALAEAVPARYRMLILLAAWSGARWGELVALNRDSIDLERGTMRIDRQYVELEDNRLVLDSPKSAAGVRTVHIPPHLVPELRVHIEEYAGPSLIFTTGKGDPLSRGQGRLPYDVGQGAGAGGTARFSFSRLEAHGKHARGLHRRQHQGADGADGPRLDAGRADLPARHR